jgi:hypothetical protein
MKAAGMTAEKNTTRVQASENNYPAKGATMKTAMIAAALAGVCTVTAFASEAVSNSKGQGQDIEQKKIELLQHIDERIANSRQEKVCVQGAQTNSEMMSCREKYRPQRKNDHHDRSMNNNEREGAMP